MKRLTLKALVGPHKNQPLAFEAGSKGAKELYTAFYITELGAVSAIQFFVKVHKPGIESWDRCYTYLAEAIQVYNRIGV